MLSAGKSAAALRFDALTALHTALAKGRVSGAALAPLLCKQAQLVPLLVQCMDEDWYAETRRLGCFAMQALLALAGNQLDDDMRRQIYPELTKRMDDGNDSVRVATAGAIRIFAEEGLHSAYDEANARCVHTPL